MTSRFYLLTTVGAFALSLPLSPSSLAQDASHVSDLTSVTCQTSTAGVDFRSCDIDVFAACGLEQPEDANFLNLTNRSSYSSLPENSSISALNTDTFLGEAWAVDDMVGEVFVEEEFPIDQLFESAIFSGIIDGHDASSEFFEDWTLIDGSNFSFAELVIDEVDLEIETAANGGQTSVAAPIGSVASAKGELDIVQITNEQGEGLLLVPLSQTITFGLLCAP